jgi:hypothetical protein
MKANESGLDRMIRVVLGVLLLALSFGNVVTSLTAGRTSARASLKSSLFYFPPTNAKIRAGTIS